MLAYSSPQQERLGKIRQGRLWDAGRWVGRSKRGQATLTSYSESSLSHISRSQQRVTIAKASSTLLQAEVSRPCKLWYHRTCTYYSREDGSYVRRISDYKKYWPIQNYHTGGNANMGSASLQRKFPSFLEITEYTGRKGMLKFCLWTG